MAPCRSGPTVSVEYQPGACNIGSAERRVRYVVGAAGFLVAAGLAVAVPVLSLPRWALLGTGPPLFGGFVGYYQGRAGFCVRYAMEGVYNVGDRVGERARIEDPDAVSRDRRAARRLLGRSALSAGAVTLAIYLFATLL